MRNTTVIEQIELSNGKSVKLFKVSGQFTGRKQYSVLVTNPQGAPDSYNNLSKGEAADIYSDIVKADLVA